MKQIPKIIHQIWSGIKEPLPEHFRLFGKTWKDKHPAWEYSVWDNTKINVFILENYPQYWNAYNNFKYDIQRWDVIRYLILDKLGGMYVDFDYECMEPLDNLLNNKSCCFSAEPYEHAKMFYNGIYFNNALMASVPGHPFMKLIINRIFNGTDKNKSYPDKMIEVLETTGPLMLSRLHESYNFKDNVYIIPEEFVSPFSKNDIYNCLKRTHLVTEEFLDKKLEKALAVHYFLGGWC